jgi:glycosyltransferase involved in cell wall biosynthesis
MNIGIEASCLCTAKPTGIAHYAKNLIQELNKTEALKNSSLKTFYSISQLKKFKYIPEDISPKTGYYLGNIWPIKKPPQIIHGLDGKIPNWHSCNKILTVHDLLIHIKNSEVISPRKFREKKIRQLENILPHLDEIIAVSETTKQDVIKHLGFDEKNITVTPLGVSKEFTPSPTKELKIFLQKQKIFKEYILFVGSISGRKNTAKMIEAFSQSKLKKHLNFILAGGLSYKAEETTQKIQQLGLGEQVKVLPFIDKKSLIHLYSGARAFVFTTLYEGFGLPILEAMSCRTPVLTSLTGSAPEVAGEHAVLVNPYSTEDIARGLEHVVEKNKNALNKAQAHARTFSWEQTAQKTIQAYKKFIKI